MKEIPLTQGKVALVDDEDFEALSAVKWFAHWERNSFYAMRMVRKVSCRNRKTSESMHRVILARKLGRPLLRGEFVDHKHGNGLDNRRDEIRLATTAQNNRNRVRRGGSVSSIFLGVHWNVRLQKWSAQVGVNKRRIHLGRYDVEMEAALAREYYIAAHPELMARSNFNERTS